MHYERLPKHTLFSQDIRIHEEEDAEHRDPAPERLKVDPDHIALRLGKEACLLLDWMWYAGLFKQQTLTAAYHYLGSLQVRHLEA